MIEFLKKTAGKAGAYQLEKFNTDLLVSRKKDSSMVSEVDKNSEEMIMEAVRKEYPGCSFVCEESGETGESDFDGYTFIIDPLDGTSNYLHGVPLFAVSIGVMRKGEIEAGVIYNPAMQEMYYAAKNGGAFLNGKPIRVSEVNEIKNGLFGTGFYYSRDEKLRINLERFYRVQYESLGVRRPGAAAIDLAWTACGRYDAFWETGLHSWDMAAGALLVKEAGGTLSSTNGSGFDIFGRDILATNTILHNDMVEILN
ncbi:MAG: inositol monophosphatase family protein [Fibrobacterota bacterium]